jgi:hypothetical protein
VESALAKYDFTEILVCREQDCVQIAAPLKNLLIVDAGRREFRDEPNVVPIGAETVNNLLVDAFVRHDFHPATFSAG